MKPGCMSQAQIQELKKALRRAGEDPSLLCDLEGCGPVTALEIEFSRICKTRFALAVSSGTAAIHTALLASGIGPGDEVIVSPYSWPQSVAPVIFTGAKPVFADINPHTLNLDPVSVSNRITHRTRAILPVHLFGHSADMRSFEEIAKDIGATLICDAAHALGARLDNKPIGAWGDIACFSLGRGKLVSGGEGGVLTTNNEEIFERAVCLTQHPERIKRLKGPGQIEGFALNYRIHPLAALLALCDLRSMDKKIRHRNQVVERFWEGLGTQDVLLSPLTIRGERPVAYGIPLIFQKEKGREALALRLQERGVPLRCGPVRIPLHLRLGGKKGLCPVAEKHCRKRELWALSALDMDGISLRESFRLGSMIRQEIGCMLGPLALSKEPCLIKSEA